ncbi:MAG: SapC family protein [Micavibrio sp.]
MAKEKKADNDSTEAAPPAALPLFYSNPVPLDGKKHVDLGLKKNFGLSFCAHVNAVPINMIEMPQISHYYPIAFSPDANATPVALMGVRDNENLFVDGSGQWQEDAYIPAYIRRYPFIFSEIAGTDQLTLCVDMDDKVIEKDGEQKFFEAEGKPSLLAQNALEFCKSYHAAAQQTQAFSKALAASGLLVERQAEINIGGGKRINFSGFRIVDEQKLANMPEKDFLEWRRNGWLPFLYAHLFSGGQWSRLTRMLSQRLALEEPSGTQQ